MQPDALGNDVNRLGAPVKRERAPSPEERAERRSVRKIRFTAREWWLVEERARTCGCAPARYVRNVALDTVPKATRIRGHATIIRELGAIAGALRELKRDGSHDGDDAELGMSRAVDALISRLLAVVERLA